MLQMKAALRKAEAEHSLMREELDTKVHCLEADSVVSVSPGPSECDPSECEQLQIHHLGEAAVNDEAMLDAVQPQAEGHFRVSDLQASKHQNDAPDQAQGLAHKQTAVLSPLSATARKVSSHGAADNESKLPKKVTPTTTESPNSSQAAAVDAGMQVREVSSKELSGTPALYHTDSEGTQQRSASKVHWQPPPAQTTASHQCNSKPPGLLPN